MEELQKKYDTLVRKYNALLAENEELQSILLQHLVSVCHLDIISGFCLAVMLAVASPFFGVVVLDGPIYVT